MTQPGDTQRYRIRVNGVVQGVGFRPFVYNLATRYNLTGFVTNDSNGVLIEAEGAKENLKLFIKLLKAEPPPLSMITDAHTETVGIEGAGTAFEIRKSTQNTDNQTLISPDAGVCNDCLSELFDLQDRRYLYPFINCTNCGPRYTIINGIPYDRPNTTMSRFTMCRACQAEYDDPANRRFHAQPNACPVCGPKVWYELSGNSHAGLEGLEAVDQAVNDIREGKIVAIKGLGGFHLAVDATNADAVNRLRLRKNREEKPLAIMVEIFEDAEKIVAINQNERIILSALSRPIVLLKRRYETLVADNVAPGNQRLGVILPYTPLHFVLFQRLRKKIRSNVFPILVMTSANLSEEPIAIHNDEARERLSKIADSFLMHDRDILIRSDDSVVLPIKDEAYFIRRSRGYVPQPVFTIEDGAPVLALGGELKSAICLLKSKRAFLSQHIGDLENLTAHQFFEETEAHLKEILEVNPETIVCDMHPAYFSTQWALMQENKNIIQVQHHHAHLAACMADNDLNEPVIGIILDGAGYGNDGKIWGGEVLIGGYTEIRRFAHLEYMPLPGGDAAIREPWRIAAAYLEKLFGDQFPALSCFDNFQADIIRQVTRKDINCAQTSSCGRLFDAVAVLAGGKPVIRYEAQAAIEMMQAVRNIDIEPFDLSNEFPSIPLKPIFTSVLQALKNGENFSNIAARFHRTIVELFTRVTRSASLETGIKKVVLSGGVLQNEILLQGLIVSLEKNGFTVFYHRMVPANDGGISLGQAVIARMLKNKGLEKPEYIS